MKLAIVQIKKIKMLCSSKAVDICKELRPLHTNIFRMLAAETVPEGAVLMMPTYLHGMQVARKAVAPV